MAFQLYKPYFGRGRQVLLKEYMRIKEVFGKSVKNFCQNVSLEEEVRMGNSLNTEDMELLKKVALGSEKADIVIEGGDLVNVYSGELIKNQSVAIKGKWIAFVAPDAHQSIGPETKYIDASGKTMVPGFIDAHTHIFYCCTADEFIRYGMRGGTTTIITELVDIAFAFGYSGVVQLLDNFRNQPIKVFATVPPCITLSEGFRKRAPKLDQLAELLQREDVVGVGEGYWHDIIRGDSNFPALSSEALRLRKSVEGHAAGCRADKLRAYLAYGVSSCHESVNVEEALEKLRLGLYVMIREGSVRRELKAIAKIKDMQLDFRRLVLVSDSIDPRDLIKYGYMEFLVQRAIDIGFDPVVAIQMATLNPAEHFGLDSLLGGIAPGRYADIVIIPDPYTIKAEYVISNGQIIVQNSKTQIEPCKSELPRGGFHGIQVKSSDFIIPAEADGTYKVRVIDQVTELVTRETFMDIFPEDRELKSDPVNDLLKVSLITWEGKIFTGFIKGLGMKRGALATSYIWEGYGIVIVGADDEDMSQAIGRVTELGGGIVLCVGGEIIHELPLPIGGMLSDLFIGEIAQRLEEIQGKVRELGFRFPDALLTLSTLTTPAIPFLRISEQGLVDIRTGRTLDVIVK